MRGSRVYCLSCEREVLEVDVDQVAHVLRVIQDEGVRVALQRLGVQCPLDHLSRQSRAETKKGEQETS